MHCWVWYCYAATMIVLLMTRAMLCMVGYGIAITSSIVHLMRHFYMVIMTLAFLYQVTSGLSPFFVLVSAISALPAMNSSCVYVRANLPVMAEYMGSMTSKSVGKRMSK